MSSPPDGFLTLSGRFPFSLSSRANSTDVRGERGQGRAQRPGVQSAPPPASALARTLVRMDTTNTTQAHLATLTSAVEDLVGIVAQLNAETYDEAGGDRAWHRPGMRQRRDGGPEIAEALARLAATLRSLQTN